MDTINLPKSTFVTPRDTYFLLKGKKYIFGIKGNLVSQGVTVGWSAKVLRWPRPDDAKRNAYELLKAGSLPDFLSYILGVICLGKM